MPCSLQPFERGSVTALGYSCKTAPRLKDAGHFLSEHLFILIGIILYSASKSTMSGKFYTIHYPNKKALNSQQWLMTELARYCVSLK
jgi:hypothetical protein